MRIRVHKQTQEVAGGRLASSAQPPRATLFSTHRLLTSSTPQPFRSISYHDTQVALLEGLRCFPASRPLPTDFEGQMAPGFLIIARGLK